MHAINNFSEQHENVLKSYNEKWNKYREVYEERPLAQVTRKMKLEAATLDMEGSFFYSFISKNLKIINL